MGTPPPGEEADEHTSATADPASALFLRYRRDGDRTALEQALLRCAPALRQAARRLGGAGELDDLVHDCFVVAIRRADGFDARGRLLPWLLGILQNLARSRHRQRWWRLRAGSVAGAIEAAAGAEDAAAVVDRNDWFRAASAHVQVLPEPYRTVVAEHLIAGESLAAIAARLGRPANTVRSQFARGLQELRRRLPAPMLTGIAAILATRSASASPWAPSKWHAARALAAGALLATCGIVWSATGAAPGRSAAAAAPSVPARSVTVPPVPAPATNERALASLAAAPGLSVRLHHSDGRPAAGIPVIFDPAFTPGLSVTRAYRSWRFATTDAAGDATFPVDTRGSAAIRLHDMGVLHRFEIGDAARSFSFTIPPVPDLIVELVDEERRPLAGGTVFLSGALGVRAPGYPAGTTDAAGKARIRSVLPGYTMWATAPGHAVTLTHSGRTDVTGSHTTTATLQLARSRQRGCGVVVGDGGAAVADATVAAWTEAPGAWPRLYASTDAAGRFAIDGLPEGPWCAAAVAPGLACAVAERLEPAEQPVLRLTRGGDVRGRVEVPGHAVRSALRIVSRTIDGKSGNPLDAVGSTVADDDTFVLPALAAGEHAIGFFEQPSDPTATRRVTVTAGATTEVAFAVSTSPIWDLRVVDEFDRPLVDHLVRIVSSLEYVGAEYEGKSRTDARGVARLAVTDDAPRWLFVHLPRDADTDLLPIVALGPMPPRSLATITLPAAARAPCALRGELPPDCIDPDANLCVALVGRGGSRRLILLANGRFRADQLPAGDYQLHLQRDCGGVRQALTLAEVSLQPGDDADLGTLPSAAFGEVEFELAAGGSPTVVSIMVRNDKGHTVEVWPLVCGQAMRRELPAGRYSAEYADSDASVRQRAFDVVAGGASRVELQRTPGVPCRIEINTADPLDAKLLGSLQGPDHKPWLFVFPRPADGRTRSVDVDLRPGVYRLAAFRGDGVELRETLVVSAAGGKHTFPFSMP